MTTPGPGRAGYSEGRLALDAALLRIHDLRGEPVGAGFLVADGFALTCAHVVAAALRLPPGAAPNMFARIEVDLPLLAAPGRVTVGAVLERFVPQQPSGAGDVAVLRLEALPEGARPVRLLETERGDVWDHPARAFGFPAGRPAGVWHRGVLRARQANGWVQADLVQDGYRVGPGFSGGPVWDDQLVGVVGMTVVAESSDPRSAT